METTPRRALDACQEWEGEADDVIEESTVMFEAMRKFLEEKDDNA